LAKQISVILVLQNEPNITPHKRVLPISFVLMVSITYWEIFKS
jgi:hypothetical protein